MNINPIKLSTSRSWYRNSAAARRHSVKRFGYQVVSVSREEAQNILDFRLVLEGGYLRQSIGHITEENLAELAEIDERCKQSTDSVWDHWEANTAFHLKLISFS